MGKPCMHYGIPCEAGTEGNCVCRKRFFASSPQPERCKHGIRLPHRCRDCEQDTPPASEICQHYARRSACSLCSPASGSGGT